MLWPGSGCLAAAEGSSTLLAIPAPMAVMCPCISPKPAPAPAPAPAQLGMRYTITTLNKLPPPARITDAHFAEKVPGGAPGGCGCCT